MRFHSPRRQKSTRDLRATRKILAQRCGGRCDHCGMLLPINDDGTPAFAIHHRQARSQGGTDSPENCLAVAGPHHNVQPGSIHQEPRLSVTRGWIVPRGQDPATTPVLIAGRLCLLTADGGVQVLDEVA